MTKEQIISEVYNEIKYFIRNYAYDNYGVKWGEDFDTCRQAIGTLKVHQMVNLIKYEEFRENVIMDNVKKEMTKRHFNTARQIMLNHLNEWLAVESLWSWILLIIYHTKQLINNTMNSFPVFYSFQSLSDYAKMFGWHGLPWTDAGWYLLCEYFNERPLDLRKIGVERFEDIFQEYSNLEEAAEQFLDDAFVARCKRKPKKESYKQIIKAFKKEGFEVLINPSYGTECIVFERALLDD